MSQPILEIKDLKVCYHVEAHAVRAVDSLTLWYTRNAPKSVACDWGIAPTCAVDAAFDNSMEPW